MKQRGRMYDIRFMRALFTAAESEALAAGEREPGAEHLVIACLGFQEGSARRVFERVGADPDGFRTAVAAQRAESLRSIGLEVDGAAIDSHLPDAAAESRSVMRTAPSAREVFPEVVRIVKRDKAQLSGAYVLMVAAQSEHSTTARALAAMDVEPDAVVSAARAEIASGTA
jgi:hypothetical protein